MLNKRIIATLSILLLTVSACARDLSSDVYTSDATMALTMNGEILSVRPVKIKDSDDVNDNTTGMAAGGILGGAAGSGVGKGSGKAVAIAGAAIVGALIGAFIEAELGEQDGFEYILKVDTSKLKDADYYEGNSAMRAVVSAATTDGLITAVQGNNIVLEKGQKVYAIFDGKRARLIAQ